MHLWRTGGSHRAVQTCPRLEAAKILLTLCLGFCITPADAATERERSATLEAIHNLENPRDLTRPGPCGELGAYQFRESTWRVHTSEPFYRALDRALSEYVAIRHYEWLKQRLESAHVPVTPYTIALAWNGGLRAAVTGRASPAARDYARRAANLVAVLGPKDVMADAK